MRSIGGDSERPGRVERGDYHGRMTVAAAASVARGEITVTDLGVYTVLCSEGWRTGVVETLILDLARRLKWGVGDSGLRNLRNSLARLKRSGLVAYETTRRQRAAWRIEISWIVEHLSRVSKSRDERLTEAAHGDSDSTVSRRVAPAESLKAGGPRSTGRLLSHTASSC